MDSDPILSSLQSMLGIQGSFMLKDSRDGFIHKFGGNSALAFQGMHTNVVDLEDEQVGVSQGEDA